MELDQLLQWNIEQRVLIWTSNKYIHSRSEHESIRSEELNDKIEQIGRQDEEWKEELVQ